MNGAHIGWEIATIGTILTDPSLLEFAEDLTPQDFTGSNGILWRHILALHGRGALEPRTLLEALRSSGELEHLGADVNPETVGEAYLAFVVNRQGGQIEEYVRQVVQHATRRQLRQAAALIAADALNSDDDIEELLDEAERRIMTLRRARGAFGLSVGQIMQVFMPRLEGMRDGTIIPAFVPKLQAFRDIVRYLDDSEFLLVAGRPGSGKSSYLRYEAYYKGKAGIAGLIFNLENSEIEYAKGFISLETGIDSEKLRYPRLLSRYELEAVRSAAQSLSSMPIEIVTLGSPSVAEVERIARAKMRTLKPKFIMLDYIQLVNNGIQNKVQDLTMTSQMLKAMTMKNRLNIPIIAAAQLSRDIERRGPRSEPQLSDLRESGSLEQDASMVIFPREQWVNPSPPTIAEYPENCDEHGRVRSVVRAVPIRMYVKKNRNGPVGTTGLIKWCKHTGSYQSLVREGEHEN